MGLIDKILDALKITSTTSATQDLTEIPKQKGETTTFKNPNYPPGNFHQMDLLFLPEDTSKEKAGKKGFTPKKGYRYLLVITDIGSGAVDARPLKTKEGKGVLKAVQDVYESSKYLKEPKFIFVIRDKHVFGLSV